ncbi:transcription initiation factor TFIID subunit 9B-like [Ruditapes philippinarum]|uniref:transcription initiation factor TFIID subunit 9B-like n=1 Tax=Ruditapes philippinarum TaxID=129788 RepID=UPI00295A8274|nr:transcription initiation factor TFIID subunit 9B-like [Ruditapes philippinarum]
MSAVPAKSSPRDAQVMAAILKDMGVTEHEPRLINQMLEFTYLIICVNYLFQLLLEIARHKNSQSLPLIKPYTGPRLPPDRYCLSAPNYKLVSNKKKLHRIPIGLPVSSLSGGQRISLTQVQRQSTGKIQIGTPTQPLTVINRPSQVKPIVRVQQGQGLMQGQVSSGGSLVQTQIMGTNQQVTMVPAPGGQTLLQNINPLKRKIDDDYDT